MVVTFFDTLGGFSAYNTLVETGREPAIEQSELFRSQPILDNSLMVMPPRTDGLVMISRYAQRGVTVTWFGRYRPMPARMSSRGGSYCGVGLYIADRTAPAALVVKVLEALLDAVMAEMEGAGPNAWHAKEAYDRALDGQPSLGRLQEQLSRARVTGGIDPSGSGCCAVDIEGCAAPLGVVADEVQDGDGFDGFQRALILRDEEAFLAVNRRTVAVVDERGAVRERPSLPRPTRPEPPASRRPPAADPDAQPRPSRPPSRTGEERAAFADEVRRPWITMPGVALALGLLNSAVLCAWAAAQALPRLEAAIWPAAAEADAGPAAADLRAGDPAKASPGRGPMDQQIRSASDAVGRLLGDDTVQRTPALRTQLEQVRDLLRPAAGPPAGPR